MNILSTIFDRIGQSGPIILIIWSVYLLWDKPNLFFYYIVGVFINAILNLCIKGIIQEPRPSEDLKTFELALKNGRRFVFKDGVPHDIFGMPSGHTQSSLFSAIFILLSLRKVNIFGFYMLISFIVMAQRVAFEYHTIQQVIVGAIVGMLFGYFMFYMAQNKIMGVIREKIDEFGPK
jgi:membrane-associated phospholipid phosphatase